MFCYKLFYFYFIAINYKSRNSESCENSLLEPRKSKGLSGRQINTSGPYRRVQFMQTVVVIIQNQYHFNCQLAY